MLTRMGGRGSIELAEVRPTSICPYEKEEDLPDPCLLLSGAGCPRTVARRDLPSFVCRLEFAA